MKRPIGRRSRKYEEIHLRAYDVVSKARQSLTRYTAFDNQRRQHSSLDGGTPDDVYFNRLAMTVTA